MSALGASLLASAIPVTATITGGAIAIARPPGASLRGLVQHVAAGAVFAAVASELVFDLIQQRRLWPIIIGFSLGTGLMLTIRQLAARLEARPGSGGDSAGLLAAICVDVLIDGFVLGIGFAAGSRGGLLLTAALTLELVFLGLTVAAALGGEGASPRRVITSTTTIALLLPIGSALGALLGRLGDTLVDGTIAFAAAALLYLVTEELLVEAHEHEEGPLATASFFAAFLAILVLDVATR